MIGIFRHCVEGEIKAACNCGTTSRIDTVAAWEQSNLPMRERKKAHTFMLKAIMESNAEFRSPGIT